MPSLTCMIYREWAHFGPDAEDNTGGDAEQDNTGDNTDVDHDNFTENFKENWNKYFADLDGNEWSSKLEIGEVRYKQNWSDSC